MTPDVSKGITTLIQISGLGGLKHNTILLSWPKEWRKTKRQNVSLQHLMGFRQKMFLGLLGVT